MGLFRNIAQVVERRLDKAWVIGSIPIIPTNTVMVIAWITVQKQVNPAGYLGV